MPILTKSDLERAVEDERRQGTVGYNEGDGRSQRLRAKAATIVIREANAKGWSYDDLVLWVDSKCARWFWDELYGCDDAEAAARQVTLDWVQPYEGDYIYGPNTCTKCHASENHPIHRSSLYPGWHLFRRYYATQPEEVEVSL